MMQKDKSKGIILVFLSFEGNRKRGLWTLKKMLDRRLFGIDDLV